MRADLGMIAVFAAVFSTALVQSLGYRWQVAIAPGMAAGLGLLLMCALLLRAGSAGSARHAPRSGRGGELLALGWFLGALTAVTLLGFSIGGALFVLTYVLANSVGPRRLLVAGLCAVPVPLVFDGVFGAALGVRLFRGLLFD